MEANLDVAIQHVRTVALWHPTLIRRAPIGMYYIYEDRRIRVSVSDQAGLDDYGVWAPAHGDDWATVLQWSPYMAESEAATGISSGCLDPVSARFGSVQEPGVPGLARGALELRRATRGYGELKMMGRSKRRITHRRLQCESHMMLDSIGVICLPVGHPGGADSNRHPADRRGRQGARLLRHRWRQDRGDGDQ